MKADTLSLNQLFNRPVTYLVPLFQRPYVWTRAKHWVPLWEDLTGVAERLLNERSRADVARDSAEERTPPHFLGAVVLEQIPTGAGMIDRRHVIDGQQRLTTLQVLLDAAQDVAEARGFSSAARLFEKLTTNDPDLIQSPVDRYKVWPTNADQPAFAAIVDDRDVPTSEDDDRSSILWAAYDYFIEAIQEWLDEAPHDGSDRLEALRSTLWGLVRVVVIDLEARDNAQVIFETLNARGTPLLASDLVKNHLFRELSASGAPVHDLYKSYWEELDDEWWRTEIRQGRLVRPRIEVFLFHWLTMRGGREFSAHDLFPEFKRYASESSDGAEAVLSDIADVSRTFRRWESLPIGAEEERFFYRLRVMETTTAYPLLLLVLGEDDSVVPSEQKRRLQFAIESWLARRMICRLTTKNYNLVFLALLDRVRRNIEAAGDIAVAFFRGHTSESRYWPSDDEIAYQVSTLPAYRLLNRSRVRMILEAVEDDLRTQKAEDPAARRGLPIEHVLPQSWTEHWPLPDDAEPLAAAATRDVLKHSLGNLTLVTSSLNSASSNSGWERKRDELRQHTTLHLNKELVHDFEHWDERTIQMRAERVAHRIVAIWPGPDAEIWGDGWQSVGHLGDERVVFAEPDARDVLSEQAVLAPGEPPEERDANHARLRAKTDDDFVLFAVDDLEDWLRAHGFSVLHRKGTHHTVYRGREWIGGYYLAKKWIHFWFPKELAEDQGLADISGAVTIKGDSRWVVGNIGDTDALDVLKKAFEHRL